MKTIRFKSTPENWKKEYLGLKPNTIRKFEGKEITDIREELLFDFIVGNWNLLRIEITNIQTREVFSRRIIDVTKFDGYYIISWDHKHI